MTAPVLELRDVCIDAEGQRLVDSISLKTEGERIGLRGAGNHILSAISCDAQVSVGELLLLGVECEQARRRNLFGLARPWTSTGQGRMSMNISEGLVLSAMAAGASRRQACEITVAALSKLGLGALARQQLAPRVGLNHFLAGLAEAALFDPELIVVEWPMAMLTAEEWSHYGTSLALLLNKRRWLVGLTGPSRLPVEQSWVGALDQVLWLDSDGVTPLLPAGPNVARCLLVLAGDASVISTLLSTSGLECSPAGLGGGNSPFRAAYVVELPRDEFGRPCTDAVLAFCDTHQLPIVRLEPLDGVC